jgi:broad specificity phosphatase PhoE
MRFVRRSVLQLLLIAAATPACAQVRHRPIPPRQQTTVVILVRHAEKDRSDPRAVNPELTAEGQRRARDLARVIRGRRVRAIITTHLKRARQTAQPAAEAFHVTPEVYEAVGDGQRTGREMAELVRRHMGEAVLVVGHSNTIPVTIEALGGPKLTEICDSAFSNLFILVIRTGSTPTLNHTHFGAADPPGGRDCVNGLRRER